MVLGSAWVLVEILHRAGCPKGVLNLVMGQGSVVGQAMLDSPEIDAMSFTGSVQTGKRVAEANILHMRKVQLEMGCKNPLVVLNDSDLDVAVNCALNGAFFSTGQRCTASSRLVVQERCDRGPATVGAPDIHGALRIARSRVRRDVDSARHTDNHAMGSG